MKVIIAFFVFSLAPLNALVHGNNTTMRPTAILAEIAAATHKGSKNCVSGYCPTVNPDLKLLYLDPDYDLSLPPPTSGKPVQVGVSINLRNILQVNEITQTVSLEISLRLYWKDSRVRLSPMALAQMEADQPYLTLHPSLASFLWSPDVFIDETKSLRTPSLHVKPASLRVHRNQLLRLSARVNLDVFCAMHFQAYPGDTQICRIRFESFGYTSHQLKFDWHDSCNVNSNISLPQFDFHVHLASAYDTSQYYDLDYPGLVLKIVLRRKLSYHLVQTYIPSAVYLSVSWLALFVPPQSIAERLAMAMTIMLTLTAMFASERQNVPRVSYVTYLDMWMLVCIVFVFVELAEFTLVLHLSRKNEQRLVPILENWTKIMLPFLFAAFNVIYWYGIFEERIRSTLAELATSI